MNEAFLHYLWKYKLYSKEDLTTTEGEAIEVVYPGTHNDNAGPDFLDARIRIGKTLWAGHVELHIKSSAWNEHGHQHDKNYDNIILHVVYEDDISKSSLKLPTLILKNRYHPDLWNNYTGLMRSMTWVACSHRLKEVPEFVIYNWMDAILVERLQSKVEIVNQLLKDNNESWEESFYQRLAANFGLKVNTDSFQALAKSTPLAIIQKHKDNPLQIEALLFGQAGFLDAARSDEYRKKLHDEYQFLKGKFKLTSLYFPSWKFLRLRPAAFPTIRIAQLAALLSGSPNIFSRVMEAEDFDQVRSIFQTRVSDYWSEHYVFERKSAKSEKAIGDSFFNSILVNTIVPFLFAFSQWKGDEGMKERAFRILERIQPENNQVIRKWQSLGVDPQHAGHSQALLQLKREYCDHKKCVNCAIGNYLINNMV